MRQLAFAAAVGAIQVLAQTWSPLPDFPGTARDDAAAFEIQGKVYVGTGRQVDFGLTNDWWSFDTGTATWAQVASLPASPRQYCAAFTVNDTGYVFGGQDGNGALAELWAYYPQLDQWVQKASLPAEARSACAAAEGWDYGIVATGMLASGVPTNEAWRYRPAMDEWEALSPVPGPSRHRAAGMPGFNGVVVAGGADSAFAPLNDAWSYAVWFETGEWDPVPALPEARAWLHGASNGLELLIGGQSEPGELHADCWKHGATGWEAVAAFGGGPRKGLVAVGQANGIGGYTCYAGLGIDSASIRMKDWWKLDVSLGVAASAPTRLDIFPNPAQDHLTMKVPSGIPPLSIRIVDATGRTVLQATNVAGLDISDFAPGSYSVLMWNTTTRYQGSFTKMP